jgi:hypothetical protein
LIVVVAAGQGIAKCWSLAHAEKHHLTDLEPWVDRQRLQLAGIL